MVKEKLKRSEERQICSPSLIQNESGDKMMLQKKKSGFILLEAVLAILLMSMASYGLAMISALQFNQLEAKHVANEAEQYAMNEVEYLKQVGFYDLDEALHDRKSNFEFSGVDGWESVTSFVTEKVIDDDRSVKIAKVEVYKEGENIPRYSMEVPLSSQGSNSNSNNFPDYSRRYLLAQNKEYIAETNGYVYIYWWDCPSHYRTGYLTIDGMKFVIGAAYGNNTNQHHKTVFFPISKGSSYLIDGNVYYQAIYFVPCK